MKTQIAHGGMDVRGNKKVEKPKVLDSLRLSEGENGGHIAEHHFEHYEHAPEKYPFAASSEKVELPKGHVLTHIAEHLHIPHSIAGEKAEHESKAVETEEED